MEKKKSNLSGYLLIAVFVVPLLIAISMYVMRDTLSIVKSASHGQLIHPAKSIEILEVKLHSGEIINIDNIRGKWTYLLYSPKCDLNCEASLFKLRQTKIATGRESNRVQSIVITKLDHNSADILSRYKKMHAGSDVRVKLESGADIPNSFESGKVYLIDPLGNLMMQYDKTSSSKGMLKDIKKLLKISNIG